MRASIFLVFETTTIPKELSMASLPELIRGDLRAAQESDRKYRGQAKL
jgi:hypothetical protein